MANKKKNAAENGSRRYVTRTLMLPDGTRKYFYGATAKEAEAKRAAYEAELKGGINPDDDTTFGEVAKVWLDKYKAPYLRPSSLANLRSQVNTHIMPSLAHLRVKDVTPLLCQNVLSVCIQKEYSHVGQIQSYLLDILDVAVELGCIAKSPLQVRRKVPTYQGKRGEKSVLSPALYQCILGELTPLSPEHLYLVLGAETGMRCGEILALEWKNIDLERRTIRVQQQLAVEDSHYKLVPYTKTQNGIRTLPITPSLYAILAALGPLHLFRGFVLRRKNSHYTRSAFSTLWEHIRSACAVYDPKFAENFTSHTLRHTYVTRLVESGLDVKAVQELSGHATVNTTLGVYTHFDRETRQGSAFDHVRELFATENVTVSNLIYFPKSV